MLVDPDPIGESENCHSILMYSTVQKVHVLYFFFQILVHIYKESSGNLLRPVQWQETQS
jgi:hypothetical protein